jgi:isopentenyl diphosphate isomerase/L-lactate dehydrogenase-like FMN-dependent dehydrogenase
MARRRLPGPIFHYIDGAAYERCDLVPNVLAGVERIDMSTTVMGQKLKMPLLCSPTALQGSQATSSAQSRMASGSQSLQHIVTDRQERDKVLLGPSHSRQPLGSPIWGAL